MPPTENAESPEDQATITSTSSENETTETDSAQAADESTESVTEPTEETADQLPEWARKELAAARSDAASYRVKLRDAEKQIQDAGSLEDALTALQASNAALERQVLVSSVAREFKLPDELAAVLQGDDEAALKAHAEVLKKFAPQTQTKTVKVEDLGGGLEPEESGSTFDAVAEARKARAARNRR